MNKINMMIVLLALCVNSCFGIKCFFCESNSNKDCENNLAYVKTENCTTARITAMGGDWLSNSFQKATDLLQVNLPMACSKTVFTTGGQKSIVRGCVFIDKDPCEIIKTGINGKNLEHCSTCTTDQCNSADLSKVSTPIIAVSAVFMILKSIF